MASWDTVRRSAWMQLMGDRSYSTWGTFLKFFYIILLKSILGEHGASRNCWIFLYSLCFWPVLLVPRIKWLVKSTLLYTCTLDKTLFPRYQKNMAMFNWWPCTWINGLLRHCREVRSTTRKGGSALRPGLRHTILCSCTGIYFTSFLKVYCFWIN